MKGATLWLALGAVALVALVVLPGTASAAQPQPQPQPQPTGTKPPASFSSVGQMFDPSIRGSLGNQLLGKAVDWGMDWLTGQSDDEPQLLNW